MGKNCSTICNCTAAGGEELECSNYQCPANSLCENEDGLQTCVCAEGYEKIDGECVAPAVCRATGDPHIYLWDGGAHKYMGSCTYVLAQDECEDGLPKKAGEANVLVAIKNWKQEKKTKVTWVKEVYVFVDDLVRCCWLPHHYSELA